MEAFSPRVVLDGQGSEKLNVEQNNRHVQPVWFPWAAEGGGFFPPNRKE